MMVQDHVRARGEAQRAGFHGHTALTQPIDLLHERQRIERDTIRNHIDLPLVQDPRGDQMQDVLLLTNDDRVPGVRAALIAHDDIGVLGKEIDDLPLALIAPLGTKDAE